MNTNCDILSPWFFDDGVRERVGNEGRRSETGAARPGSIAVVKDNRVLVSETEDAYMPVCPGS